MNPEFLLSAIIFVPVLAAFLLAFFDSRNVEVIRFWSLGATIITFGLTLVLWNEFDPTVAGIQMNVAYEWIPTWNVWYRLGVDGISLPLVLLTGLISMLSMAASWSITKHVKGYMVLFLLLESGMMGVFLSLDFFLFYVFWEVMLLPMYFLIGVLGWAPQGICGHQVLPVYSGGSVLMLIAMLMFYFNSGAGVESFNITELAKIAAGAPDAKLGSTLSPTLRSQPSYCCLSASQLSCRPSRFTPGCPMHT